MSTKDDFPEGDDFRRSQVGPTWERPDDVVVSRALAHAAGLQPEDYGVLIRLLLRDPDQPSSVLDLSKEFQASGWKMGEKRLREVMKRLKAAGHIQHGRWYNPKSQRPEWQFRVYRNPANNRAYVQEGADAFSQVSPIGRKPADRPAEPISDPAETGGSAGQADRAETGGSEADPAETGGSEASVSAGQADQAETGGSACPPPTPPQGEVTTSPSSPPRIPSARTSQKEEGEEIRAAQPDPARVETADSFLSALPGRWACGLKTTRDLAPLLAQVTAVQGWDFDRLLISKLTENPPEKIHSLKAFLKGRIEDLPRRAAQGTATPEGDRCPYHPGRDAATCPPCRAGDDDPAADPERSDDTDAVAAAKAELHALLAPARNLKPKRRQPRRSRRTTRQDLQRREAEKFEERRAAALRSLEKRFPEAGDA